jgi:hypothetical protein
MKQTFLMNFLRFFGIIIVFFGILGLGSGVYIYYRIKPKMENLPNLIEEAYSNINSKTDEATLLLREGGDLLKEVAEKANFSLLWVKPFEGFDEDLCYFADSLYNASDGLERDIVHLERLKEDVSFKIDQFETVFLIITLYFSMLHFIFIIIGLSLFYIGGYVNYNIPFFTKIIEEGKEEKTGNKLDSLNQESDIEDPFEILKIRLQIGEITQEEYDELYMKLNNEKDSESE